MEQKNRYTWIDYAKVISILLVISYHTPPVITGYIGEFLRQLRMPVFFLIAGYLFRVEKFPTFKSFLVHRSKQLLIPYLFFFALFYILWLFFRSYLGAAEDVEATIYEPVIEFIYGNPRLIIAPYWFVCCLFSMQIIHYSLLKIFSKQIVFFICLLLPFVDVFFNLYYLPWNIGNAFKYLPFYSFAYQYKYYLNEYKNTKLEIIAQLVSYSVLVYFLTIQDNIYLYTLLFLLSGIVILPPYILFCKTLARVLGRRSFIEYIGKNTIIILGFQNYVIAIIKIIAYRNFGNNFFDEKYFLNFIISLAVIIIIYPIVIIINKYFPFIVGRGKYFQTQ